MIVADVKQKLGSNESENFRVNNLDYRLTLDAAQREMCEAY